MDKELGITEAREKLADLVEQVQFRSDAYIIKRHGKAAAAIVPVEVYENWKRQRSEFFELIRQVQQRSDLQPEEAEILAVEAVRLARK
jgi:prevent-host-death family protein